MKLKYWVAKCNHDADCFAIRTKTKRECIELRTDSIKQHNGDIEKTDLFDQPKRVLVEYKNAFDLMDMCSTENHHFWEWCEE